MLGARKIPSVFDFDETHLPVEIESLVPPLVVAILTGSGITWSFAELHIRVCVTLDIAMSHEALWWLVVLLEPLDEIAPLLDVFLHPCLEVIVPVAHLDYPFYDDLHPLEIILVVWDDLRKE